MQINDLLSSKRCLAKVEATSKKRALELLATTITEDLNDLDAEHVFISLIGRERLGSTGIGFGVAIPHARIENCQQPIGALITLNQPIDFDAIDGNPVDIIFAMLVPENADGEHLQTLASLVQSLNSEGYRQGLRTATTNDELLSAAVTAP